MSLLLIALVAGLQGTAEPLSSPPSQPVATQAPQPVEPAPSLPPSGIRIPARAETNLASYVGDDDYPLMALRNREDGTTSFRLTVDRSGRVTECVVTNSSGSASIDNATCRIMLERARFTPAIGNDGLPTEDQVSARMTWHLNSRGR